jgi:hypothetical protein
MEFTREDADALRDAADILTRRLADPDRSPPALTGVAMLAEGLRREADLIEDDLTRAGVPA